METLRKVPAGDVVLLHGCCHNPTGADLTNAQWDEITEIALERGFIPFIDTAYQGLGDGLEEDAYGMRTMAEKLPEIVIASSCSKNFGLYRERTGSITFITQTAEQAGYCCCPGDDGCPSALLHASRSRRAVSVFDSR